MQNPTENLGLKHFWNYFKTHTLVIFPLFVVLCQLLLSLLRHEQLLTFSLQNHMHASLHFSSSRLLLYLYFRGSGVVPWVN